MTRIAIAFSLFILIFRTASAQPPSIAELRKSLVRINTTSQSPNLLVPWNPGNLGRGVGSGFVINGERILTNAHVVSNARFLSVEKESDPKKYVAAVEFIAHDADLAVLRVADPAFFENTAPLEFDGIPELESTVSVLGYPIGGDRLSVTQGVVSRVDFQSYSHTTVDAHLAIQIDAAINPGNSGGPVLQDGKVVGVAFQGYSGDVAQNVGYMIPVPVILRFLKDIEDGKYDRYMDLAITMFPLQNDAMRRALGVEDEDRGVYVGTVYDAGPAAGIVKEGDVILAIDGYNVASDGFLELDGQRVQMSEIVERKFRGDTVKLAVLRERKKIEVSVPLDDPWPFTMQSNRYDFVPRYVLFGGLLFQPLSRDFLMTYKLDDLQIRFYYDNFVEDEIYKDHPEVIVLSQILADPINTYLNDFLYGIVESINERNIRTLADVAEEFAKDTPEYVIRLIGVGRPLVLEKAAVDAARERILTRYNVLREQNLNPEIVELAQ
jgi:S1-C subfamily serine protease